MALYSTDHISDCVH